MKNKSAYICPVCGYDRLPAPPRDGQGSPTYVICPCCGFESGYDDDAKGHTSPMCLSRSDGRRFPFPAVPAISYLEG